MTSMRLMSARGTITARVGPGNAGSRASSGVAAAHILEQLRGGSERAILVELCGLALGREVPQPARLRDVELYAAIEAAVASGRLALGNGWHAGGAKDAAGAPDAAFTAASTVVDALMGVHDDLTFEGRRFRLIAGGFSARAAARSGYRLVPLDQVPALLGRMAAALPTNPAERQRWADAVALGRASGSRLRVLRYEPGDGASMPASDEAPVTPSQLRPQTVHWIEVEVVFDDGTPYTGNCTIEAPGGNVSQGAPGEDGVIRLDGLTPGSCKVSFPDVDGAAVSAG